MIIGHVAEVLQKGEGIPELGANYRKSSVPPGF